MKSTTSFDDLFLDGTVVVNPDIQFDEHVALIATESGDDYFIDLNSSDFSSIPDINHSLILKIDRRGRIGEISFHLNFSHDPQRVADRLNAIVNRFGDQLFKFFLKLEKSDQAIPRLKELIERLCVRLGTKESISYIEEQMDEGNGYPRLESRLINVCQASDALMALS